jgi:uncharacterized membrane protein HdeD (DUF308 family)
LQNETLKLTLQTEHVPKEERMGIVSVDCATFAQNWGAVMLRGAVAIGFGLLALFVPGISFAALILTFGAYAFVDGIFLVISAIRRGDHGSSSNQAATPWWVMLLQGIAGIAAGIITWFAPLQTALALLYIFAAWTIITGIFEIVVAIRLRKVITGEWLLALGGVLSVALGIALFVAPVQGAFVLMLWMGAYALLVGFLHIGVAFKLRSWAKSHEPHQFGPPAGAIPQH